MIVLALPKAKARKFGVADGSISRISCPICLIHFLVAATVSAVWFEGPRPAGLLKAGGVAAASLPVILFTSA